MSEQPQADNMLPSSVELFRQAMAQNAEIHRKSLDEISRQTDEAHTQLRAVTLQRIRMLSTPGFNTVWRAAQLDPNFWVDTIAKATKIMQDHGELPKEPIDEAKEAQNTSTPGAP